MDHRHKLFIEEMRPLPRYPGRKAATGQWQKILSEIPQCDVFIEAMAGSGYLSSIMTGCDLIVNDIDPQTIDGIRCNAPRMEFRNEDYVAIINRFDNGHPRRVFYFDPPYMMATRSHQAKIYRHDWKDKDHDRFLKAVKVLKCPAIVSHYPCPKYDKALSGWRKTTYKSMTRGGVRDEALYMNFPQPALLHCWQHVGEGFTDRQRIQRKISRLIGKLNREDPQERAAILSALVSQFSYITGNPAT